MNTNTPQNNNRKGLAVITFVTQAFVVFANIYLYTQVGWSFNTASIISFVFLAVSVVFSLQKNQLLRILALIIAFTSLGIIGLSLNPFM